MSAATILEQQAHANIWNAMHGYSPAAQLARAEHTIRQLHAVLVQMDADVAAYAPVAGRPALLEVALMRPEIAISVRDMYDGVDDPAVLLHYRGEALRRAAEFLTEVEHLDRLIADGQGATA